MKLTGKIIHGHGRGQGLGLPTINLDQEPDLEFGVYAVWVVFDGVRHPGAMNWGPRPTFAEEDAVMEVHLLDFSGDIYGRLVELEVVERIRNVMKFENPEALQAQIAADITQVREILYNPDRERLSTPNHS